MPFLNGCSAFRRSFCPTLEVSTIQARVAKTSLENQRIRNGTQLERRSSYWRAQDIKQQRLQTSTAPTWPVYACISLLRWEELRGKSVGRKIGAQRTTRLTCLTTAFCKNTGHGANAANKNMVTPPKLGGNPIP